MFYIPKSLFFFFISAAGVLPNQSKRVGGVDDETCLSAYLKSTVRYYW